MDETTDKQKQLDSLVLAIELYNRTLTMDEREKTEMIQVGLKASIDALVERCKSEEMDFKISAMEKILAIVKPMK